MQRNSLHHKLPTRLLIPAATGLLLLLLLSLMIQPLRQMIFLAKSGEIRNLDSNSRKLEKLVFTTYEFTRLNFTRPGCEFIYRGNLYDIHSITKTGYQVVVLAVWDATESTLLKAFRNQDNPDTSLVPGVTRAGFMPYFCIGTFSPDLHAPDFYHTDYQNIGLNYSDPFTKICSPPPELLTFS